jgi:hypothetical protein
MFVSWSGLILLRLYQFYSTDVPCWCSALGLGLLNLQGLGNSLVFAAVRENEEVSE